MVKDRRFKKDGEPPALLVEGSKTYKLPSAGHAVNISVSSSTQDMNATNGANAGQLSLPSERRGYPLLFRIAPLQQQFDSASQ